MDNLQFWSLNNFYSNLCPSFFFMQSNPFLIFSLFKTLKISNILKISTIKSFKTLYRLKTNVMVQIRQ